ncbi:hypothetical protein AYO41_04150 [Verrucomicrobia bacterium SCGC AG-212-E04]|nr:hypothetical protein AYO41_04150 [Verrucomicrobia bacterium SCGC AG-212-E04]
MSDASTQPAPRRRKLWRWLRWGLLVVAVLLGAVLIFLRPIAFFVARHYTDRIGRETGLKIAFVPGGNVWSSLSLDQVLVTPTGAGTVRDVRVGRFRTTYSLWTLLRSGLRDFVDVVEIENVTIALDVSKPPPPPTSSSDEPGGGIPAFPLPRKVIIHNVSIVLEQAGGHRVELAGLTLELVPNGDGRLEISKLAVPGLKPLAGIRGTTSYANRDLQLRDVVVPGIARFQDISLALEKLSTGWLIGSAEGDVLGGKAVLKVRVPASLHLWERPGSASLSIRGLPLAWPSPLLADPAKPPPRLAGMVDEFDFSFASREKDADPTDVRISVRMRDVRVDDFAAVSVVSGINAVMNQATLKGNVPWFSGLVAECTGEITQPQAKDFAADRLAFRLGAKDANATIDAFDLVRGGNTISLTGRAKLPANLAQWQRGPLEVDLRINAPDLGQLALEGAAPPLRGKLEGGGTIALAAGAWTGNLGLAGRDLLVRDLRIQSLDARLAAANELAWIEQLDVRIDLDNTVSLGGYVRLTGTRDFRADVKVDLSKLVAFDPLLQAAGVKEKVEGALKIDWHASGSLIDPSQLVKSIAGGGTIAARSVKFGGSGPFDADIEGSQGGAKIELPTISLRSGPIEFRGSAQLEDSLVSIERISLRRGNEELAGGFVRLPVDLDRMKIADVEKVDVDLVSARPLPLAELWTTASFKGRPPIEGTLGFALKASGSLSKLVAEFGVQGRGLRKPDLAAVRPADVDFTFTLRENRLTANGSVRQPQMQALTIRGEVPFDAARLVETGKPDLDARLTASVRLPPSSLGVLIGVVPGLRFVQGDAAADVEVGGTLGKPTFRGSMRADMPAARFENLSIPALRDFHVRIGFREHEVRFEQFQGEVAGGRVNVGGRVEVADLHRATINLAITTKDVLVLRDDNITVRVNSDVKVEGPVAAATVTGRVGLTKSRFLKDVDIVPLRLPGEQRKPVAAPPPPRPRSTGAQLGINTPPLRDWKFNLSIVTDDAFRVRGNLANGRIIVDLKLTGTGARPLLEGPVTVEQLTARLPFSRLDIAYGTIYFTPDQPFNPLLNLNGESQIRDRRVNVTIFGRADDPKTIFTSDPPLAQEQILTLLATGATLDELRGDAGALAGKAAILAAQSLWRKIFKTKGPPPGEESLRDRFDVDIGATDPRTGKQAVTAQFRVTDRVTLVSDFDSEGNFRGQVRYLIRFR